MPLHLLPLLLGCRPDPVEPSLPQDAVFGEELARIEIPAASSLWVDSARGFVCTGAQGVYVVQVADPRNPALEDIVDIPCTSVDGESGKVYVAAGERGVEVLHPGNLSIMGSYDAGFPVDALMVDSGESQAWIAGVLPDPSGGDDDRIAVQGIATYTAAALTMNREASLDPGLPLAIAYDRSGVYVARDDGTVDLLGLAMDLRARLDIGQLAGGAGAGMLAEDHLLWLARGTEGLLVVDTRLLDEPVTLPGFPEVAAWGLAAVDDRLYVGSDEALVVLDRSDPAALVHVATLALPGLYRPEGIYVLGDLAWVTDADDGALSVVMIDEAAE